MPIVDRVEHVCDGCTLGKQHRTPFPRKSTFRAQKGLELFHADLCGQVRPPTVGGKLYFLLVVDDHSRYMWVELLKTKDEALASFQKIKLRAEVDYSGRLKALRTDGGGEFNSNAFTVYCNEQGIKHYTTTPYSPQQNGVVERRNQSVVEMVRCMLKSKGVPSKYWGEAINTAVYLLNRSPTKSLDGKTPYEAWHGKRPRVDHLRTFGCIAHVKKV
jgi:transposase InsO family protein